jgi:hypothetical protein
MMVMAKGPPPKPAPLPPSKSRRLAAVYNEELKASKAAALRTASLALKLWVTSSSGSGSGGASSGSGGGGEGGGGIELATAAALLQARFRARKAAKERRAYEDSAVVKAMAKFDKPQVSALGGNARDGATGRLLEVGWVRVEGTEDTEGEHYYVNAVLAESTWIAPLKYSK